MLETLSVHPRICEQIRSGQWTGQNRPFVDTANPAISGARDER